MTGQEKTKLGAWWERQRESEIRTWQKDGKRDRDGGGGQRDKDSWKEGDPSAFVSSGCGYHDDEKAERQHHYPLVPSDTCKCVRVWNLVCLCTSGCVCVCERQCTWLSLSIWLVQQSKCVWVCVRCHIQKRERETDRKDCVRLQIWRGKLLDKQSKVENEREKEHGKSDRTMKKTRRTTRTRKHERQRTIICEKEIKRQWLVKENNKKKNLKMYTVYLSTSVFLRSFSFWLTHCPI